MTSRLNIYSAKGVKKQSIDLPRVFQEKENPTLLAQAIRVYEAGRHPGLSKTKTRSEVAISTRKIYRQKGTGRARHGSKRAPIFVGGGITHGPKGVKRKLSLPKKIRQKALKVALAVKAKEGKVVVIDGIAALKKTKEASGLLGKIIKSEKEITKNSRFTFILSGKNLDARLALRNLKNVEVIRFDNLNAHQVYFGGILIIDKEALKKSVKSKTSGTGKSDKKSETLKR